LEPDRATAADDLDADLDQVLLPQSRWPPIFRAEATLEHFAGDGLMAYFNNPLPCPNPAVRAVRKAVGVGQEIGMPVALRRRMATNLASAWGSPWDMLYWVGLASNHGSTTAPLVPS